MAIENASKLNATGSYLFMQKYKSFTFIIYVTSNMLPVADLRGARGTPPCEVQILSISCSFWEILTKLYVGAPPPGSWRPLLGEILDPPLVTHSLSNRSKLYSVKAKRIARIILPVSTAAISYVLHWCRQHLSIGLSCRLLSWPRYPVSAIVLSWIWFQSEDVMSRFE